MNFRKISNNSSQGKNGTDETSMKKKNSIYLTGKSEVNING